MSKKVTLFVIVALLAGIFYSCENMEETSQPATAAIVPGQEKSSLSLEKDNKEVGQIPANLELPDFKSVEDNQLRKEKFLEFMKPIIRAENHRVLAQRKFVKKCFAAYKLGWELSEERKEKLKTIAHNYKLWNADFQKRETYTELLMRVDEVPVSLALMQAANESAWGTSYFARKGNNIFGQWCFREGCGMVPRNRPEGANHEVEVFPSVQLSVRAYINNLNTHKAYEYFRNLRYEQRLNDEPLRSNHLALGLQKYSSKGMEYVEILQSMLETNQEYI
ncbi:MAG: glucosaminidase domain-containing protein [Bacteroidales bacterium]|nr:glucosaminidase domain-containing protein [Bacteroidales bacterium]MCF8328596.1 glucosaminidase domain-containing protein [Bacteroidales bacterium]